MLELLLIQGLLDNLFIVKIKEKTKFYYKFNNFCVIIKRNNTFNTNLIYNLMTKLENTILYLLSRVKERGKDNLSKFELFKFLYLLENESYKFAGKSFFDNKISFVRYKNGPISINIYNALNTLKNKYINLEEEQKESYDFPRHCISLKKRLNKIDLDESEKLFINSVVESYITLSIKELKKIVYATEPMEEIIKKEKKSKAKFLKGEKLNFNCILLDEDVVDLIAA